MNIFFNIVDIIVMNGLVNVELTLEIKKCLKRYFVDVDVRRHVNVEFANFFDGREGFDDVDFLRDRGILDKKSWWLVDNW